MSDSAEGEEISVVISWQSGLLGSVEMADTLDTEFTGAPKMAVTLATGAAPDLGRHDEVLLDENGRPVREDIELMQVWLSDTVASALSLEELARFANKCQYLAPESRSTDRKRKTIDKRADGEPSFDRFNCSYRLNLM